MNSNNWLSICLDSTEKRIHIWGIILGMNWEFPSCRNGKRTWRRHLVKVILANKLSLWKNSKEKQTKNREGHIAWNNAYWEMGAEILRISWGCTRKEELGWGTTLIPRKSERQARKGPGEQYELMLKKEKMPCVDPDVSLLTCSYTLFIFFFQDRMSL